MLHKTKTNTDPPPPPKKKWEVHLTIDQQQQNHRLKTNSSLSYSGAEMHFTGAKSYYYKII